MDAPATVRILSTRHGAVWSAGSVWMQWRVHKSVSLQEIPRRPLAHRLHYHLSLPPPTPVTFEFIPPSSLHRT